MTDKLQEYAQLLINVGLNVQKDQYVVISSQVDCAYFARMCIAAAYEAGAKQVIMNWNDDFATRQYYLNAADEVFDSGFPVGSRASYRSFEKRRMLPYHCCEGSRKS